MSNANKEYQFRIRRELERQSCLKKKKIEREQSKKHAKPTEILEKSSKLHVGRFLSFSCTS